MLCLHHQSKLPIDSINYLLRHTDKGEVAKQYFSKDQRSRHNITNKIYQFSVISLFRVHSTMVHQHSEKDIFITFLTWQSFKSTFQYKLPKELNLPLNRQPKIEIFSKRLSSRKMSITGIYVQYSKQSSLAEPVLQLLRMDFK